MKMYINQIPSEIRPYVTNIVDVRPDGNCGYRCIAALLGMGESCWPQVRRDLYEELYDNQVLYEQVFIEHDRCTTLLQQLQYEGDEFAPLDKWMTMLDMCYIVATKYNIVLFCIS